MQAWNWGATATQPQTFAGGVTPVYQNTPAAQTFSGGQIPQTFPAASALVPGQQMLANYQQFYGGAVPTSTEVPAGYTAQQWEAAQQQHFMQWQQWNQQFQQWQQEYGNTYSMAVQGCQQPNVPPTSTAEPPPLPPPDKPPPPPDEGRGDPLFQMPPVENFKGQKRPNEDHSKFQEPADKKHHGDGSQSFGRDSKWGSAAEPTEGPDEEKDRSEQEKMFDAQFLSWEQEFLNWKQQNINHPDKNQYLEYEKKWTKWRQELLHRREQMRKKRLASMAKASPDSAASKNKQKGDRTGFPDSKISRNLDSEFNDPNKQQGNCGPEAMPPAAHSEGFGFKPPFGQQQHGSLGAFPANSEQEAKPMADLPLQFTGPYAKKGYSGADVEKEDSLKLLEGGNKDVPNTWNQNFQSNTNFSMNQPGNNQQANGSSHPSYVNQVNSAGSQNLPPDSELSRTNQNSTQTQHFSKDQHSDTNAQQNKANSSLDNKVADVVDITTDDEDATNFGFLKKSNVIPGLDLCPEKNDTRRKGAPNSNSKLDINSSQSQSGPDIQGPGQFGPGKNANQGLLPLPGQGMMPSQGQGLMPLLGQPMVPPPGQSMMVPPPGQGLLPPPGFMSNMSNHNMNQWPGLNGPQGHPMNRGQGFQGNMPGFGSFGQGGQMGNLGPNEGPGNNPNFSPGNQGPFMGGPNSGPGNQNSNFSPGNVGPNFTSPGNKVQNMAPGNQNQNVGAGGSQNQNMSPGNQNQSQGPNFSSPNKGPNMMPGNQNNTFADRGPNYNNGLGNQGPPMGPGNNSNFGPGNNSNFGPGNNSNFGPGNNSNFGPGNNSNFGPANMHPNFNMNMKGPNMMPPNFGPGGQGGPMNVGSGNQSSFGSSGGPNFGPGNQNAGPATGNQGPHFDQGDQFNRNNQGFGNIGSKNMDHPGALRDQMAPGGHGAGGDQKDWGELRDGRNQGPNNWNDNMGQRNQSSGGRDSQNAGPRRDMNQGPLSNFPHGRYPGDSMNQFPPKDGFPDGKQGGLMGSCPPGSEPFNKGMKDNYPGKDTFGGIRESFSKDGPNFPPERENFPTKRENFPKDDFPDVHDGVPTALGMSDRTPGSDNNFRGPRDGFSEGPDFRGPRNRFMDDRDAFQGAVDPLGPPRGPGVSDAFPPDTRGDFDRERFPRRDNFDPIDSPRGGYPDRDFNRGPFRDNFRGRDETFHGDRNRAMDFDDRRYPREQPIDDRGYEYGRGGIGWDQRGGDRPPHDYYRSRQFGDREDDPYSKWDRSQHPPGWENPVELEPVTIVEYGHKPAPTAPLVTESSSTSMLENVQTFDYGHGVVPRNVRDATSDPWRRDDFYNREQERDRRSYERDGRWEKDRDRDRERDRDRNRREEDERSSKHTDDDRYRSRSDDRWGRRSERENDRDRGRSRDSKREGDSGRNSKSGPPPCAPPPPSFSSPAESGKGGTPVSDSAVAVSTSSSAAPRPILVEDLLSPPGRDTRPQRIVIILRGPPGSGKTFVAKLIKDKEVEMGGPPPRILCLDDYFMVELEKEEKDPETGRKVKVKAMEYEYEAGMEKDYRCSLVKSFKKTVNENYFPFVIVDCVNQKVKDFEEMWSYAKQKGFQVYISEMDMDISSCSKRNTHNRTEKEIQAIVKGWEETPKYYLRLDVRSLLQSVAITEVEMEDSAPTEEEEKKDEKEEEKKNEDEGKEADEVRSWTQPEDKSTNKSSEKLQ